MKNKAGNILMVILLLFGTTGLSITRHYCGNNLVGTALFSSPENCCGDACTGCHDDLISFRISDQFESLNAAPDLKPGSNVLFNNQFLPQAVSLIPGLVTSEFSIGMIPVISPSPPGIYSPNNTPSFLRTFRI